jgi:Putative MetA-pathway of phenol degradation
MRLSVRAIGVLFCLILFPSFALRAQSFFEQWQARVNQEQAAQPHWVTPLVTVTPRLEQEFRTDFARQVTPRRTGTWIFDNGKGLELIPGGNTELLLNLPAYDQHNTPATRDGWGDLTFNSKVRILAGNEQHGNYILTAYLGGSLPTGSYSNGSPNATVTPQLGGGKGFGNFAWQATLGVQLPVIDGAKAGRPITFNNTFQYALDHGHWWPEVETNTTYYKGGDNDGRSQSFVTPGVVARYRLHERLGITLGAGIQIATSAFHTYNHGLLFTARMPF